MKTRYGPYSPSRLDVAVCPFSFYRQYIDPDRPKEREAESLPQARGSALHEVLEQITKSICSGSAVFSAAQLREWVGEAIKRHPAAYPETDDVLRMARNYIERPPRMLTTDAQTELRLAVKHLGGDSFEECDYEDPEAFARGRADIFMISDDLTVGYIIDHKSQPNIETADTAQMGFYAWVLSKIHPYLKEIRTILHFTQYGCYSDEFAWTKEILSQVEDTIRTKVAIAESLGGEWPSIPNDKCQYCPFIPECPSLAKFIRKDEHGYRIDGSTLKILGDTNRAVETAGFLHQIDEVKKIASKELRDFVKKTGPVAIPGKVYEYQPETKIHWDTVNKTLREEAYKVFEKYGLDPRLYMSFNQTTSQAIWLIDNPALLRELSELFPRKTSTEFSGRKI